ncbi:hypothetical protein AALB16_08055 [Lachnospiraceae bacterium 62-35]
MKKHTLFMVYLVLFEAIALMPCLSSPIAILIIIINLIVGIRDKKSLDLAIISSFLLPSEVFAMFNLLLMSLLKNTNRLKFHYKRPKAIFILAFLVVIVNSFISSIVYDTEINLLFYLIYLLTILATTLLLTDKLDIGDMVYGIKVFLCIEFVIVITIALKNLTFIPGDIFCGTMSSAHWFGNWLIVSLVVILFHNGINHPTGICWKNVKKNIPYLLILLIMLYLSDSKSLIVALAIGSLGYIIFEHKGIMKYSFMFYFILFYVGLFIVISLLYLPPIENYIKDKSDLLNTYLYTSGWNGKFEYIRGTLLEELRGIRLLTGFGLGQYGSRVANLFAYTVMWRADNGINNLISSLFAPHYLPQFARYISFYDYDFVAQIGWRSAVLSYPFNSVTAFIAEIGLIGVAFFSYIISICLKKSDCKILGYYFLAACFFDLYFDSYQCLALIILVLFNTRKKETYI